MKLKCVCLYVQTCWIIIKGGVFSLRNDGDMYWLGGCIKSNSIIIIIDITLEIVRGNFIYEWISFCIQRIRIVIIFLFSSRNNGNRTLLFSTAHQEHRIIHKLTCYI